MKQATKKLVLAATLGSALSLCAQQSLAKIIIDDWGIDLTGIDGISAGGTTYSGLGSLSGLDDIVVSGASEVTQTLEFGVPTDFVDSGYLGWTGAGLEAGGEVGVGSFASFLGSNDSTGDNFIYIEFLGLTGSATGGGGIAFDVFGAQTGTVKLWLDDDSATLSNIGVADANRIELASFSVIPVSNGSGIGTDGGAFPSGVVGITLELDSLLTGVEFTDPSGTITDTVQFSFVDTDATIDTPADLSGIDATGSGTFTQTGIENDGSMVLARAPEPGTIGLAGLGLLALAGGLRKRKSA